MYLIISILALLIAFFISIIKPEYRRILIIVNIFMKYNKLKYFLEATYEKNILPLARNSLINNYYYIFIT